MNRRHLAVVFSVAFSATVLSAQNPSGTGVPSNAEIQRILAERIDTQRQGVGLVVGVIEPAGRRIVAHGTLARGDARSLDGNTVFEIGSITKVFTSLLLSEAVRRGEVALTDPVGKYLPTEVRMPQRGNRAISLLDLSTHTSGLPRLPGNIAPKDPPLIRTLTTRSHSCISFSPASN